MSSLAGDGRDHAFSWTAAGGMIDLGPLPGGIASIAHAVNDRGQVVGISQTLVENRAVYWMPRRPQGR
jgi:probable HAF family extracellular repeat protein